MPAAKSRHRDHVPVVFGDDKWQTPIARFKVIEKNVDPAWFIRRRFAPSTSASVTIRVR